MNESTGLDPKELQAHVEALRASKAALRQRNEELEILNGLLVRTGRSLSVNDVLDGLLTTSLTLVGPTASGGIFLLDSARRELRLTAHRGLSDAFLASESSVQVGDCLCGSVALSGKVLISGCSTEDARHTIVHDRMPHGHVIIPLLAHEEVLGVLFLYTEAHTKFTPERERLFGMMGRQIGIALENAQLFQATHSDLHVKLAELTRALAAVEKERARAEESERSKGELMAMVSHDLRSPLTVVLAEASDTSACNAPECRESRESIRLSARRMTAMINDVVDSARLEAGVLTLRREPILVGQVLTELVQRGYSAGDRRRLQLTLEPAPLTILGDRSWLERAILNIVGNALKFAPVDTLVALRLSADAEGLLLEVVDHGPGSPPAELPLLFKRFFRASNTHRVHGSGLGLNIARLVIEAHGGRVDVSSVLGQGVTVAIRLPLTAARAAVSSAVQP